MRDEALMVLCGIALGLLMAWAVVGLTSAS